MNAAVDLFNGTDSPASRLETLNAWVAEVAALTRPDAVHWCDGSDAENAALIAKMQADGTLLPLPKKLPLLWTKWTRGAETVRRQIRGEFAPCFMTFTTGRSADPVPFFYSAHDIQNLHETGRRLVDVMGLSTEYRIANVFPDVEKRFAKPGRDVDRVRAGIESGRGGFRRMARQDETHRNQRESEQAAVHGHSMCITV